MCTCFIHTSEDNTYIAMNFDNNGMDYFLNTKKNDWFLLTVGIGKQKSPCFGVHKNGIFISNLCVDPNDKGIYRRAKGCVHTEKLLTGILNGTIDTREMDAFLKQTEIVNVPGWSTHNMIRGAQGDVWIVEPGRGVLSCPPMRDGFQLMTNFSLIDSKNGGGEIPCERYRLAHRMLSTPEPMNRDRALAVLKAVRQNGGEWITDFSMVYDKKNAEVIYCEKQDFETIHLYRF